MDNKFCFECPYCTQYMEVSKDAVGRKVQCYKCEEKFELTLLHKVESKKEGEEDLRASQGELRSKRECPGVSPRSQGEEKKTLKVSQEMIRRPRRKKKKLISLPVMMILLFSAAGCYIIENRR